MAFNWYDSDPTILIVNWQEIDQEIAVNSNKELIEIKFECISENDGIQSFFDNLGVYLNIEDEENNSTVTYIPINIVAPIFAAINNINIRSIKIVFTNDITGTEDSYLKLSIIYGSEDEDNWQTLCTKTMLTNADKNTIIDFGPVDSSKLPILKGNCLKLKIEKINITQDAPDGLLIIEWENAV